MFARLASFQAKCLLSFITLASSFTLGGCSKSINDAQDGINHFDHVLSVRRSSGTFSSDVSDIPDLFAVSDLVIEGVVTGLDTTHEIDKQQSYALASVRVSKVHHSLAGSSDVKVDEELLVSNGSFYLPGSKTLIAPEDSIPWERGEKVVLFLKQSASGSYAQYSIADVSGQFVLQDSTGRSPIRCSSKQAVCAQVSNITAIDFESQVTTFVKASESSRIKAKKNSAVNQRTFSWFSPQTADQWLNHGASLATHLYINHTDKGLDVAISNSLPKDLDYWFSWDDMYSESPVIVPISNHILVLIGNKFSHASNADHEVGSAYLGVIGSSTRKFSIFIFERSNFNVDEIVQFR